MSETFGSSPHARGTQGKRNENAPVMGFIPACAGNAPQEETPTSLPTVHPRMRGERRVPFSPPPMGYGSSPHARGTPPCGRIAESIGRFIPACAGNAWPPASAVAGSSVHPRMRGERSGGPSSASSFSGSSPHARGTLCATAHNVPLCRFIPACAGNAPKAEPA